MLKRIIVLAIAVLLLSTPAYAGTTKTAVFAGGCFWSMQKDMDQLDGIVKTTVGYTGGHVENPTYAQVSTGTTGHREAVQVEYDSAKISYEQVLNYYWHHIDPLDPVGQFCDKGDEYRAAVFYNSDDEKTLAKETKAKAETQLEQKIFTDVLPAGAFYPAEEYHQDYYKKNFLSYQSYRLGCRRDVRVRELWNR
jgi:peptide-methionine (S)-S-oxide reductase